MLQDRQEASRCQAPGCLLKGAPTNHFEDQKPFFGEILPESRTHHPPKKSEPLIRTPEMSSPNSASCRFPGAPGHSEKLAALESPL